MGHPAVERALDGVTPRCHPSCGAPRPASAVHCRDVTWAGTCVDAGPLVPPAVPRAGALQRCRTPGDAALCFSLGRPLAQAALRGPALPGVWGQELRSLHVTRGHVRQVSPGRVPPAAPRGSPGSTSPCRAGAGQLLGAGRRHVMASPLGGMGDSSASWEWGAG